MSSLPPGPPPSASAPPGPPGAKAVRCPSCGASITLRALGQSVMAACPSCQTQIDVSQPEIRVIRRYQEQARRLRISLGTRGSLRGETLEVIGALGRSCEGARWEEYLLYSPYLGFRWLVYDQGHWNFGKTAKGVTQASAASDPVLEGRHYRPYQTAVPTVEWVVGEFYWRVAAGDRAATFDYVAPPYVLSRETAAGEVTWTLLEYVEPAEVAAAFHVPTLPRLGIALNQPNVPRRTWQAIAPLMWGALAVAFLAQGVAMVMSRNAQVFEGSYSLAGVSPGEEQVFGPIHLASGPSIDELVARSDLGNSWVELNCELVNETTGKTYGFTNGFEYYYGQDSDGAWSEGSRVGKTLLTEIPAGDYSLVVEGYSGGQGGKALAQPVALTLRHDVAPWRNFWIAFALIVAYPAYLLFAGARFEQQRWADSSIVPVTTSGLARLSARPAGTR